jgi:hypothetical protein
MDGGIGLLIILFITYLFVGLASMLWSSYDDTGKNGMSFCKCECGFKIRSILAFNTLNMIITMYG